MERKPSHGLPMERKPSSSLMPRRWNVKPSDCQPMERKPSHGLPMERKPSEALPMIVKPSEDCQAVSCRAVMPCRLVVCRWIVKPSDALPPSHGLTMERKPSEALPMDCQALSWLDDGLSSRQAVSWSADGMSRRQAVSCRIDGAQAV